ncbi:Tripartite tricarboxylate transporter family receptor [Pigmentiphaga humi]|uniref:Tripartite tricarboxylate transporter family receptor n=1 Tax=Pigmentiphaga humi TaxID=2478468 RepID=A0A3P4B2D7_9BURK|nr:tripartite tricarboxylate transporter substrate binding protein [Pigmentiphaga humi]VCU69870.1 Tripartite tricarboxylate transporter family receptor [Pigmentiphaga humi]
MISLKTLAWSSAIPLLAAGLAGAHAGDWPERPVKLVVSHAPGSSTDIVARYVASRLAQTWRQPIVIENRPGGQNIIGAQAAARAAPDGYTLFYGTTGAITSNAYTIKKLPYDPAADFVPIRFIAYSPFMVAASPALPAADLKEALSRSRQHPGSLRVATEGAKTFSGILGSAIAALAQADWVAVPYSKSSEALQDTMAGRADLVILPAAVVAPHIETGRLRVLAVSTASRLANAPSIPALGETLPGFGMAGWHMLMAPAGTPAAIVNRLNQELNAVLAKPEVAAHLASLGMAAAPELASIADNQAFLKRERDTWAGVVEQIGLQPE